MLYLDSSAFLKLYLDEADSSLVVDAVRDCSAVCTHLITYAEMRAALAQASRMKRISHAELSDIVRRFEDDWLTLDIVSVDEVLVRRAGELADRIGLRGFDAVHLAAAERVFEEVRRRTAFALAAFDRNLLDAAERLGLPVLA